MVRNKVDSARASGAAAPVLDTDMDRDLALDLRGGLDGCSTAYTASTVMDKTPPETVTEDSDQAEDDDDDDDEDKDNRHGKNKADGHGYGHGYGYGYGYEASLANSTRPSSSSSSTMVSLALRCPWPGSTYIIRCVSSGQVLALHGGEVTLAPPASAAQSGSSVHWACSETDGWLGFRNVASGRFLGYDGKRDGKRPGRHGRLVCVAPRHQSWESFCVRPRPQGGYLLLTTHFKRLWRVGVRRIEQGGGGGGGGIAAGAMLAKIDDGDPAGEEVVWEFIKV